MQMYVYVVPRLRLCCCSGSLDLEQLSEILATHLHVQTPTRQGLITEHIQAQRERFIQTPTQTLTQNASAQFPNFPLNSSTPG